MNTTDIIKNLGDAYSIEQIDGEDVIYRKVNSEFEFEITGIGSKYCILYVWQVNPRVLVGIYEKLPILHLSDLLGHYSSKYQNLIDKIQVLRED